MTSLNVPSLYYLCISHFLRRIPRRNFLKDQSERVCLTPVSDRKATGTRFRVHSATGSWRAVGCFPSQAEERAPTSEQRWRWAGERENHSPSGLEWRAETRPFHFSKEETKVLKSQKCQHWSHFLLVFIWIPGFPVSCNPCSSAHPISSVTSTFPLLWVRQLESGVTRTRQPFPQS